MTSDSVAPNVVDLIASAWTQTLANPRPNAIRHLHMTIGFGEETRVEVNSDLVDPSAVSELTHGCEHFAAHVEAIEQQRLIKEIHAHNQLKQVREERELAERLFRRPITARPKAATRPYIPPRPSRKRASASSTRTTSKLK